MKKQILFLAFFTLALIFAGLKSYGQIDPNFLGGTAACAPVTTLTCAEDDELSPIPGQDYTYTIGTAAGSPTDIASVHWFVVNASATPQILSGGYDFATVAAIAELNGGGSLFLLNAETHYNTQSANTSIVASWQSFNSTTNHILLVAYVEGAGDCADNIEAWRIEPVFAFTLDIAGLMPDGTLPASGNANECVSPVQDALYNSGSGTLGMDYGENYVYFTVTAANFVDSWQPTFTATHSGTSTITEIAWAYPTDADTDPATGWNIATGVTNGTAAEVDAVASNAVGDGGECIVVRVLVDHGNVENDVLSTVTLSVNGTMYDATADNYTNLLYRDLDNGAAVDDPCVQPGVNVATYDLTPRPNVIPVNPVDPFITKN